MFKRDPKKPQAPTPPPPAEEEAVEVPNLVAVRLTLLIPDNEHSEAWLSTEYPQEGHRMRLASFIVGKFYVVEVKRAPVVYDHIQQALAVWPQMKTGGELIQILARMAATIAKEAQKLIDKQRGQE